MTSTGQPWSEPTLWPEDTHASHSAKQADEQVKTIPDTSGRCSPSAFAWYDPDTQCWRTLQATLVSGSDLFSQTWPRSGMTLDGIAYQLPPSAPRTSAIAYSLSQRTHGQNSDGLWPTATTGDHSTRFAQGGMPLGMAARLWATPTASDWKNRGPNSKQQGLSEQVRLWPTPQASDSQRTTVADWNWPSNITGALERAGERGKLNPQWVEWLMGFPAGWTDLED